MTKQVEFLFDYGSPATYLAWTQLPRLIEETGVEIQYRPILLGGLFKATGNSAPAMVPAKGRYLMTDLARHAKQYAVPLKMNPHFPVNTLHLMRITTGVHTQQPEQLPKLMEAFFQGMWVNGENLAEPEVIARVLNEAGLDAGSLAVLAQDEAVKETLKQNTADAAQRGAFGAPTFFIGEDMFFGQDRLHFVREALAAA